MVFAPLVEWVLKVFRFKGGEMDATGNGGYLAEVVAKRWPCVVKRMITAQWYQEITPKFKAEFEKDTLIMPRDVDVYNDHRAIRLVRGVPQIVREGPGMVQGTSAPGAGGPAHI